MKVQLKRSNQLEGTAAKEPTAAQMEYGELAVNYNSNDIVIFIKDSDDNIRRIAQGESSDVIMSPTAPDSLSGGGELKDGTLWWNTSDGRLYVYFIDSSGDEQWVDASPSSSETHWKRENQILKPIAPNDSVYIGDENIKLNVDGSASTAGNVRVGDYDPDAPVAAETGAYIATDGAVVLNSTTATSPVITVKKDNTDQITLSSNGNITTVGNVTANKFTGDGSELTNLNIPVTDESKWSVTGSNLYPKDLAKNVGIGVSDPQAKLHVDGTIRATAFDLEALPALP